MRIKKDSLLPDCNVKQQLWGYIGIDDCVNCENSVLMKTINTSTYTNKCYLIACCMFFLPLEKLCRHTVLALRKYAGLQPAQSC